MHTTGRNKAALGIALLLGVASLRASTRLPGDDLAALRHVFDTPPDAARVMMRWWWFGPQVTDEELGRELQAMKDGGIGGVEVQPVYPVALDGADNGLRTEPYLSDAFLGHLKFAADRAAALGLRFDLTLGSGWPYGGPSVSIDRAAGRLRVDRVHVPPQASRVALPDIGAGESFISADIVSPDSFDRTDASAAPITADDDGFVVVPADERPRDLVVFISSRTGQTVKRATVGSEGFVLDHYDARAADAYLSSVGARLWNAFGAARPFAIFCDSLEVYASDWTADFPAEFERRRGYDVRPHLLALASGLGEDAGNVRHDWGQTLTELVEERFLAPLQAWATAHGTKLRAQVYGIPPASTSSAMLVDLPEGEGADWRGLAATRWASSASHVKGIAVTSAETWTWLHSPAFAATPLDVKAEADRQFLQGVNQLVGHGWPYSPPSAGSPGWRFYAAAALSDRNPWWIVMPDLARSLQRSSAMLRQGTPVIDVALYLPVDDAWAAFTPGEVDLIEALRGRVGSDVIPSILDAGFNVDLIDPKTLASADLARYRAIVLPDVHRIPAATARALDAFAKAGGLVVRDKEPGPALVRQTTPDAVFTPAPGGVAAVHRRLGSVDAYFVANTSNVPRQVTGHFRVTSGRAEWWDPVRGTKTPLTVGALDGGARPVVLSLAPYESGFVVFSDLASPPQTSRPATAAEQRYTRMSVRFDSDIVADVDLPHSWSATASRRYYSGVARYQFTAELPAAALRPGRHVWLDFGDGTPVEPTQQKNGMRAWLDAPIRDAAVVSVNGERVGALWCPPYVLSLDGHVRAGANVIRIDVANTAETEMAGRPLPDYRLLNLRYGARFEAQDMDQIRVEPSGLLTSGVRVRWQ